MVDVPLFKIFAIILPATTIIFLIAIRLLARNPRNRLNQIFVLTWICMIINFITTTLGFFLGRMGLIDLSTELLITKISLYTHGLAAGFLLLFLYLLHKPKVMSKALNQLLFMLIYGGVFLIPFLFPNGVYFEMAPEGHHVILFDLAFTVYNLCFFFTVLALTIYFSINVQKQFDDPSQSKLIGLISCNLFIYLYVLIGNTILNYINVKIFRDIFAYTEIIFIVFLALLYILYSKALSSDIDYKP